MAWQIWKISLVAADELELKLDVDASGEIQSAQLTGVGGPELLSVLSEWRMRLKGNLAQVDLPQGNNQAEIMLRELLLRAQGSWKEPYTDVELCHCRAIPTKVVHQAIVFGAHTPEIVSRWTSASTACGNCRKDVTAMLDCMLAKKAA